MAFLPITTDALIAIARSLDHITFKVYALMLARVNPQKLTAFPGQRLIADDAGISRQADIGPHIQALIACDYIRLAAPAMQDNHGRWQAAVYMFCPDHFSIREKDYPILLSKWNAIAAGPDTNLSTNFVQQEQYTSITRKNNNEEQQRRTTTSSSESASTARAKRADASQAKYTNTTSPQQPRSDNSAPNAQPRSDNSATKRKQRSKTPPVPPPPPAPKLLTEVIPIPEPFEDAEREAAAVQLSVELGVIRATMRGWIKSYGLDRVRLLAHSPALQAPDIKSKAGLLLHMLTRQHATDPDAAALHLRKKVWGEERPIDGFAGRLTDYIDHS